MWAEIAFTAGCLQTARNAFSRSLAGKVSPLLNSWSRFAFNLPLAMPVTALLVLRYRWPQLPLAFFGYCAATGITQILGNIALVAAFNRANFAQSIILYKLEVAFTAVIGMLFFAERPSGLSWLGISVCSIGVLFMNLGRETGPDGWRRAFHIDTGTLLALSCALLIVIASFMLKKQTRCSSQPTPGLGLGDSSLLHTRSLTLVWIEVVILTPVIAWTKPREFRLVPLHWRRMALIGATG